MAASGPAILARGLPFGHAGMGRPLDGHLANLLFESGTAPPSPIDRAGYARVASGFSATAVFGLGSAVLVDLLLGDIACAGHAFLISLAQVPRLEQHRAPTMHRQLAHGPPPAKPPPTITTSRTRFCGPHASGCRSRGHRW